jgi:hypothetical protein
MDETSPRTAGQETLDASGVQNPEVAHEHSDVNVRGVFAFGFGLLVLAVIIHVLMWGVFDYFAARAARSDRPLSPLAASQRGGVPPEPRLQVSPTQDMRAMWAGEDAVLNSYGWIDRRAGVVRIPIEQAMRLLAERGLPARAAEGGQQEGAQGDRVPGSGGVEPGPPEGASLGRTREGGQP